MFLDLIEGETRIAAAVVDPEAPDGDAALTSEAGPTIHPADWERLAADVLERAKSARLACFSGSLPPGTPLKGFSELIQALQKLAARSGWTAAVLDLRRQSALAALELRLTARKLEHCLASPCTILKQRSGQRNPCAGWELSLPL